MRVCLSFTVAIAMLAIAGQENAWAQFGGQTSPRTSAGSGGTSFGSRSGTASGLGSSGDFGATTSGQIQGNERFVRGNRQAGEFVGSGGDSTGGTTGFVGADSGTRSRASSMNSGLASLARQFMGQSNQARRSSKTDVRAHVRLGFNVARPPVASVVPRLNVQLAKITPPKSKSPIRVEVDKGTATLRGAVASAHDRAIAERLVLLEGGIWKVNNELTVVEKTTPPAPE